ncbi:B12-binding domain-containing radical SAM protein [Paenibacillus piscarius]|uniref:B12-binding domain-containing radical SAM protein n=1 Tax=Paenibacillus piscarius TaxID=1089681 RepID=UPI001EE839FB|nr:radical SAM protein [Paenibacillus piscarius]
MKKPKMLFIYPDIGSNSISFSPAIEILSAVLEQQEVEVELIHIHEKHGVPFDHQILFEQIQQASPDVIGMTSTSYQYDISNEIAGQLKERGIKVPIVLGGIHANISPEDLKESKFDAFCTGEGEVPLSEMFRRIRTGEELTTIPGFHFKSADGRVITNPASKVIRNLDDLPMRNYGIMNTQQILTLKNKWLSIAFSRGCPYACNFCINQKLKLNHRQTESGKYFRINSVNRALSELTGLIDKYGAHIDVINLDDDLLILEKEWFIEFANRFEKEIFKPYGIKYAINVRANLINEELISVMARSGCDLVRVGFETGNQEMRNRVLGKGISNRHLFQVFDLFHKYELRSLAFAMLGIPGETESSIQDSLNMLRKLQPTLIRMAIFEPFIGTPLYDYCIENGLIDNGNQTHENCFDRSALSFKDLSQSQLQLYHILFPWHLNLGFVGEYSTLYKELITTYSRLDQEQHSLEGIRARILMDDRIISEKLNKEGIAHYEYFENNNFYYHLAKPLKLSSPKWSETVIQS